MTELLEALSALDVKVDALIAKVGTPVDFAPALAAVKSMGDKIQAKIDASTPAA